MGHVQFAKSAMLAVLIPVMDVVPLEDHFKSATVALSARIAVSEILKFGLAIYAWITLR